MHDRYAKPRGGTCDNARSIAINRQRNIALVFCAIDRRICRGIDYNVGRKGAQFSPTVDSVMAISIELPLVP
jgi:hypothetical protein